MTDNLARRRPEDSKKININQFWEMRDWTKKLGVTRSELRSAVSDVGPMVADLQKLLSNNARASKIVIIRRRNGSSRLLLVHTQRQNRRLFNY